MDAAPFLVAAKDRLLTRIDQGEKRLAIEAHAGAGKSSLLRLLRDELALKKRVIWVEFPDGDDAGMVALASIASQLGLVDLGAWDAPPTLHAQGKPPLMQWRAALQQVQRALQEQARDLVLLIDDPTFEWTAAPQSELFVEQAIELTKMLLGIQGATIVLTGTAIPPGSATERLEPLSLYKVLAAAPTPIVKTLSAIAGQRSITPLALHLSAGLAAIGVDISRIPPSDLRADRLFLELGRSMADDDALRRALARLAVLRVPFPRSLLEQAGYTGLKEPARALIDALLTNVEGPLVQLPEALCQRIRHYRATGDPLWFGDDAADAHRFAAEHHRRAFEFALDAHDVNAAVRHELERIHQLTQAGDAEELLAGSIWFVEQYDALGKALSQMALQASRSGRGDIEERLRREAIQAYERALAHDRHDAYAHHYIAYNLDILATDPARAETEYKRALERSPKHAWYHSRYICLFITRGRMFEARAAWEEALEALSETMDARAYEELHGQVARLLLHASELGFARRVLDDVPDHVRGAAPWWAALERLFQVLRESRDERLVFPPKLDLSKRWDGPHLVPVSRRPRIEAWLPGCVVGRDRELHIRVARRDQAAGREDFSYLHLTTKELRDMVPPGRPLRPPVGTFVEIIFYRGGEVELKSYDRDWSRVPDADLPPLFPRPDRYIRRAFAGA